MKIDRSNYEIWLIDWLDGNLNNQEAEMLRQFLNENPNLKAEAEDLEICTLVSADTHFNNKELLKRLPSGISNDQFEYLSLAALENDLSEAQQYEFEEIINNDPAKREIFEQISKIKIEPEKVFYSHKNRLIKRTPAQRVIRMTLMVVSSAAVIALLISLYLFLPQPFPYENPNSAQLSPAQEIPKTPEETRTTPADFGKRVLQAEEKRILPKTAHIEPEIDQKTESEIIRSESIASAAIAQETAGPGVKMIVIHPDFELSIAPASNKLVASSFPSAQVEEEDARSSLGRFIARNFREKLLREEAPSETPLKGFEIAEAGVAGINKIFGWEMKLDEKKNETGETKSVYFNSRLIKFNAPVKKAEPLASSE